MDLSQFTPTEQRMLAVLSDGRPHRIEELQECLQDEMQPKGAVAVHLTAIRKKLSPIGESVVSIPNPNGKGKLYVHFRLMANALDE